MTEACTNRMMESTKGICQKSRKGATKDCFIFDSWLSSKKTIEFVMEFYAGFIGMVNTNTKGLFKETIEKITRYWTGGSYLMLRSKPMVPGGRPLVAIGLKYNTRKVLSIIVTDNTRSPQAGLLYLSKYPNQFTNISIRPVARPLVMYKLFGAVNEVDSHKKLRQSDLALEKFCVTQHGWMRLCTKVDMGMTITNLWKMFCYGVKRYQYEKLMGIRELLEQLAPDCFNNTFSTDTGTPAKKIPPLDEVSEGKTVSTFRALHFSSCIYPSAASINIYNITLKSA